MELKGFGGEGFKTETKKKDEKKTRGRGGFLSSLISEGGATGGAVAGGATGAALGSIVPGLGTVIGGLVGAGVGGLAGGLGGSAVEQKVRDDEVDWKKAATEGLVSGATSVIPGGGKLAFGATKNALAKATEKKAAENAIAKTGVTQARADVIQRGKEVAGLSDTAPPITPSATNVEEKAKSTLLGKFSNMATKSGSGLKVGQNVGDVNRLDQATDIMQKYKITGTPTKQLRKIDETMGQLGTQVDDILAKNPIQLDGTAVKSQVQQALDDPLKYADLDLSTAGAQRALGMHLEKYAGAKSAKDVNDYIKKLNPIAKRAQAKIDKGTALTDKETAALTAKKAGDEVLSQYPEIKPLKQDMAILFDRNKEVAKLAEQKANLPIPFLNIQSRAAKQAAAGAQSKAGGAVNAVDNANKSLLGQITRKGAAQVGASTVTNSVLPDQPAPEEGTSMTQEIDSLNPESTDQLGAGSPQDQLGAGGGAQGGEVYSSQNLLADIQRDPKNAQTYMGLYKLLAPESAPAKPLSAEASKTIATANSGLSSLATLSDIIGKKGVPAGTTVPGRGLLGGAGQNLLGTASYDTAADNVADAMVRARTGAAATKSELALYRRLLPQAFDSPEVRQQKIKQVEDYFTSIANRTGSAGTDLQQAAGG